MNPNPSFDEFPPEERETLARLTELANSLQPAERFVQTTETQLRNIFTAKKENPMKRFNLLWQVLAGTAAVAALVLGLIWLVRGIAPEPPPPAVVGGKPSATPAPLATATPATRPELPTYDWHGTKIQFAAPFPAAPADAKIYTHSAFEPATVASAQALAQRFGIQGQVYLDRTTYMVTDGQQRLIVISAGEFSYYTDYTKAFNEAPVALETAASAIDAFLKGHGFDFEYRLEKATGIGAGRFYVLPLTLEGKPVRFDFGLAQRLEMHVSPDGQILSLDAYLLNVDPQPMGNFGLISAEDAWQKALSDSPLGVLQSSHSGGFERFLWHRAYPDNQPVTVYGHVDSHPAAENGQPPLITLDGFPATGNTAGLEKPAYNTLVQARGQFFTENGIGKFRVETWKMFDQIRILTLEGSLRKDGDKVIFSAQGTDYSLPDAPADLPLPLENVSVTGVADGATLNWHDIIYFPNPSRSGGGGGGGCGGSLATLNLSGPPVPWPTPAPPVTPTTLPIGQRVDGVQGQLTVTIHEKTDGSQRAEYNFFTSDAQYVLQGSLDKLTSNQNRPLTVWGAVTGYNQYQIPILMVERYEIPFPDLKFQILRGTQKLIDVNGQQKTLFTSEDGKSYVQLNPDNGLIGVEGDLVEVEVLVIPDESLGGYPVMRVFSAGMATNSKTGQPYDLQSTADQPYVMPEPQPQSGNAPAPVLTIDSIELVYYTPDPRNAPNNPDATSPYLQPVWRFHGHYADGSEAEFLIQALKPDFLLPEPAYTIQCG